MNKKEKLHLDTSGWKFIEEDSATAKKSHFDPLKLELSSLKIKSNKLKELNQMLETEIQMIAFEETDKNEFKHHNDNLKSEEKFSTTKDHSFRTEKELKIEEKLKDLKHSEVESNPYLVLLNRLDEEEGVRIPSVEDKLKLTENRLRVSMQEFCSACKDLIATDEQVKSDKVEFLHPKLVQDAFRPQAHDPSLLPPRTLHVAEFEKKAQVKQLERKSMTPKQDFYPPKTWFSNVREEESLTQEELELLNSTSTKDFLKFLRDRKKEPPKIIQDIQKKVKNMKEEEKKEVN